MMRSYLAKRNPKHSFQSAAKCGWISFVVPEGEDFDLTMFLANNSFLPCIEVAFKESLSNSLTSHGSKDS